MERTVVRKLSKNILDLKFMKRSKESAERDEEDEERQQLYHEKLSHLKGKMKQPTEEAEEADVSVEEMAQTFLNNDAIKKFKKRKFNAFTDVNNDTEKPPSPKPKRKSRMLTY